MKKEVMKTILEYVLKLEKIAQESGRLGEAVSRETILAKTTLMAEAR